MRIYAVSPAESCRQHPWLLSSAGRVRRSPASRRPHLQPQSNLSGLSSSATRLSRTSLGIQMWWVVMYSQGAPCSRGCTHKHSVKKMPPVNQAVVEVVRCGGCEHKHSSKERERYPWKQERSVAEASGVCAPSKRYPWRPGL